MIITRCQSGVKAECHRGWPSTVWLPGGEALPRHTPAVVMATALGLAALLGAVLVLAAVDGGGEEAKGRTIDFYVIQM